MICTSVFKSQQTEVKSRPSTTNSRSDEDGKMSTYETVEEPTAITADYTSLHCKKN